MTRAVGGIIQRSLSRALRLTTGCSETALETTTETSGTRPATADIMNEVEPWQWMIALTSSARVCSRTVRTACGWSWTAVSSSVQRRRGMSIEARQFSIHTSQPSSSRASTIVRPDGARKMFARTPAPWTSRTGPLVGIRAPVTWTRLSWRPSPAVKGTTCSTSLRPYATALDAVNTHARRRRCAGHDPLLRPQHPAARLRPLGAPPGAAGGAGRPLPHGRCVVDRGGARPRLPERVLPAPAPDVRAGRRPGGAPRGGRPLRVADPEALNRLEWYGRPLDKETIPVVPVDGGDPVD